jgi:hypothetical protein
VLARAKDCPIIIQNKTPENKQNTLCTQKFALGEIIIPTPIANGINSLPPPRRSELKSKHEK